jgi:hypothetical protein
MPQINDIMRQNYNKQYYEENKERIKINRAERIKNEKCIQCNKLFYSGNLKAHLKTKSHANKVAELIRNQS